MTSVSALVRIDRRHARSSVNSSMSTIARICMCMCMCMCMDMICAVIQAELWEGEGERRKEGVPFLEEMG